MMREAARHSPIRAEPSASEIQGISDDVSPLVSLPLYRCSQAAEIRDRGGGEAVPAGRNL